MKKELCVQILTECEQVAQKMGGDLYATMRKASKVVERWKPFYLAAQKVWEHSENRDDAIVCLLALPDPTPTEMEAFRAFVRTVPFILRGAFQDLAKGLPPSPGGRPHELSLDQRREVCKQIGYLYGEGVTLADAKSRMAQRYGVSLSTIQRAWNKRAISSESHAADNETTS
jgi:hypothetical protein